MAGLKEFTLLLCYPSTTALVATGRLCFFSGEKHTHVCATHFWCCVSKLPVIPADRVLLYQGLLFYS